MMVRARVAVLQDPPGNPTPLRNDMVWVLEGCLVLHIGYPMLPCEGPVKDVDLGALIEDRIHFKALPARRNLVAIPLVEV